jgi:regulator of cell morphogenesis and NO signaling
MINPSQTVASLVLDHSECARVLQRNRIDFCCRGHMSIEAAAHERKLNTKTLLAQLSLAIAERNDNGEARRDPRALATPLLIEHIVMTHHGYLREALPFVRTMSAKVSRVHGAHNPKLIELDAVVVELAEALLPHLENEEDVLFPALMEALPDRALVKRELFAMHEEHLAVGKLLARLRDASDNFRLPDWACNSYRALFAELEQLEADVLTHVHLENHVLKPRFETETE